MEGDRPAPVRLGENHRPEPQGLAVGKAPHVVGFLGLLALYLGGIDQDEGTFGIVEPHKRVLGVQLGQGAVYGAVYGAVVGALGALGEDLAPVALARRAALQDRPEEASGLLLLALEEFCGEGHELFGTEGQSSLCGFHSDIVVGVRTHCRSSDATLDKSRTIVFSVHSKYTH